jgi:hypothetical protein
MNTKLSPVISLIGLCALSSIMLPAIADTPAEKPVKASASSSKSSAGKTKNSATIKSDAATMSPAVKGSSDRLELDTTRVTGSKELPKVLYIVPWKKADVGNLPGQPFNTLLDEALAPVDREVFRREVDYYQAISNKDQPGKGYANTRNGAQSSPQSQGK